MKWLLGALLGVLIPCGLARAQTAPGLFTGQVPTAAQWNSYFGSKTDALNGILTTPTINGGTIAGSTITGATITSSSFPGFIATGGAAADLGSAQGPILGVWPNLSFAPSPTFTGMPVVAGTSIIIKNPYTPPSPATSCTTGQWAWDNYNIYVCGSGSLWLRAGLSSAAVFNVRSYGAVGDGTTDDSSPFDRAFAACYAAGGGQVYVPSSGHDYRLASGRSYSGNGCGLVGDGIPNWPGPAGTKAQWTAAGSWISCNDTVNACFTFNGDGYVKGIDFWEDQPLPSATPGVAWTPTSYPFVIVFKQVFSSIENVQFANVTNGIDYEYTITSNFGGTYSYIHNVFIGAFGTAIRFKDVNDTMDCSNVHIRDLWNIDNSNVVTYMEAHLIGMDMEYVDNLMCSGVEFYKTAQAIYFADSTAVYGLGTITHAAGHLQMDNISFNQVVQAVNLAAGTTNVSLNMTNVLVQTDTDTNRAAGYAFNFASDNADVSIHGMEAPNIGNSLIAIGGGTSGKLRMDGLNVGSYGYFGTAAPAIVLNHGSKLDLPEGTQSIIAAAGAGAKITCGTPTGGAGSNCGAVLAVTPAVTPTTP